MKNHLIAQPMTREEVPSRPELKKRAPPPQDGHLGEKEVRNKPEDWKINKIMMIQRLMGKVNFELELDEILDDIFENFHEIIPYDRIGFALLDSAGKTIRTRWARSKGARLKVKKGYSDPGQMSFLIPVLEKGKPVILHDLKEYLRLNPDSESTRLLLREGIRSNLTCPLIARNRPFGFLFFSSFMPRTYGKTEIELIEAIGSQLSVILEKAYLYEQMVELNREKNRFLGMASHDLRSPLSGIKNLLDVILEDNMLHDNKPVEDLLKMVRDSSASMLNLVSDLLDFSAIEAGAISLQREKVEIGEFLGKIHRFNKNLAEAKGIAFELFLPPNLGSSPIDPKRIEQVLNNLITNAIKFSEPNTTITLSAWKVDGILGISVADQGKGIPSHEWQKIFTEFGRSTTRPTAGESSTGLGLAIVKRIVEAHGGKVFVDSKLGTGSTFTITFPEEQERPVSRIFKTSGQSGNSSNLRNDALANFRGKIQPEKAKGRS